MAFWNIILTNNFRRDCISQDFKSFNSFLSPFGDDWRDHRRSYKYLGTETAGNYTSGTWILLHYLSIHAKSQEDFETITSFWGNFFPCEGCCLHFMKMIKEEINCYMPNDSNILKFWKLHNLG